MSLARDSILNFLNLSLHINKHKQICVDVYAIPTSSVTYVLLSTFYPKKNIINVRKGIALRLRRICYSNKKIDNDRCDKGRCVRDKHFIEKYANGDNVNP